MNVEVIVGHHAGDDEHRAGARNWVVGWYRARGYTVTVAAARGPVWCKADAYNPAVAASSADVVVLADADSWPLRQSLADAIDRVEVTGWAAPFHRVRRLTREASTAVLGADPAVTETPPDRRLEADVHDALPGGGVVVMRRDLALECGPYDPRFVGYGGEDFALGNAARTLSGGYATVCNAPLWHLWHPRAGVMSDDTKRLVNRYRLAKFDRSKTSALIDEWRRDGTG